MTKMAPSYPKRYVAKFTYDGTTLIFLKGFMRNNLVMFTLAHSHFAEYDTIPNPAKLPAEKRPIAALILAHQAVCLCISCLYPQLLFIERWSTH